MFFPRLVHLLITMVVHKMFMVDLEALIGWKRMAIVYLGSGIGGNLASAIFVPYNVRLLIVYLIIYPFFSQKLAHPVLNSEFWQQ